MRHDDKLATRVALLTGGGRGIGAAGGQWQAMVATVPLGRVGVAEDAAGAIYQLCIPESDFVTGQLLLCSGGLRG